MKKNIECEEELLEVSADDWEIRLWLDRSKSPDMNKVYEKVVDILKDKRPREEVLELLSDNIDHLNAVQVTRWVDYDDCRIRQGTIYYLVPFDDLRG